MNVKNIRMDLLVMEFVNDEMIAEINILG